MAVLAEGNRNIGQPVIRTEVALRESGIGYFPSFRGLPLRHGFSWGPGVPNMAFGWHDGDPRDIIDLNNGFLRALGMTQLPDGIVGEAYADQPFVDITPDYLRTATKTDRGIFTPSNLIATRLSGVPIIVKPGDCPTAFMYGKTGEGEPFVGAVHAGRNDITNGFTFGTLGDLRTAYDTDPDTWQVAMVPTLGFQSNAINAQDVDEAVGDVRAWEGFSYTSRRGNMWLDMPSAWAAQFVEAGVPSEQIEIYDIDTFRAAAHGQTMSHRFSSVTGAPNGRIIMAIELDS